MAMLGLRMQDDRRSSGVRIHQTCGAGFGSLRCEGVRSVNRRESSAPAHGRDWLITPDNAVSSGGAGELWLQQVELGDAETPTMVGGYTPALVKQGQFRAIDHHRRVAILARFTGIEHGAK